ncbi:hypothetical protein VST63_27560 [Mycolicibacterium sp. 050232]|uniref:hypothetical protein n=1 Tax=Mycolicibacterium sp. 050232 TaxID=3113982 RepID=UPI002E282534|nr:hypothetical protein [Mycolicibacterium sp. 050232]MED5816133.1 hypothetical protein [Mycolicibacterium sp. 050232]
MQDVAHPYLAAGVALLGAGAIAISPVAPPMPDITVPAISSAEVSLSAAVDPIEAYTALFTNTFTNLQTLVTAELADPAPVLQQVIANQLVSAGALSTALQSAASALGQALDPSDEWSIPSMLRSAFEQLAAGDINGGVATLWGALLTPVAGAALPLIEPAINAIKQPVQNLANVLGNPAIIAFPALGLINVGYRTVTSTGEVGQEIVDAVRAGDALGVVNAMLSGPATITDTFLNGDEQGGGVFGPSLGLLSTLRQAREMIAAAITPPPVEEVTRAAADTTVASSSKVVTLDVSPKAAAAAPVAAAPSPAAATEEATTKTADTSAGVSTPVVKDSLKAEPGKTLSTKRSTSAKQVREGVQGAVKNVTDGIKKAAEGLSGKSTKAGKHAKAGGASSSGSSGASSSGAA